MVDQDQEKSMKMKEKSTSSNPIRSIQESSVSLDVELRSNCQQPEERMRFWNGLSEPLADAYPSTSHADHQPESHHSMPACLYDAAAEPFDSSDNGKDYYFHGDQVLFGFANNDHDLSWALLQSPPDQQPQPEPWLRQQPFMQPPAASPAYVQQLGMQEPWKTQTKDKRRSSNKEQSRMANKKMKQLVYMSETAHGDHFYSHTRLTSCSTSLQPWKTHVSYTSTGGASSSNSAPDVAVDDLLPASYYSRQQDDFSMTMAHLEQRLKGSSRMKPPVFRSDKRTGVPVSSYTTLLPRELFRDYANYTSMEAPSASSSSVPQAVLDNTATAPAPFGSLQQDFYMPMTPVLMEPVLMEPMLTPTINDDHQDEKQANERVGRWDAEEHRRFLLGLKRYGHGNWQNIAMLVGTRTPFQVTSHAQKFYKRQKLPLEERMNKKRSIHDMI